MKRVFCPFIIAVSLLALCGGCSYVSKHHPIFQDNTRWTCEELDFYFEVSERYYDTVESKTYGQINLNGEITEIVVLFGHGGNVNFTPIYTIELKNGATESSVKYGDKWLFLGRCKFSANKCVVTVFNNEKGFLDDSIKTLTFIKSDIPDTEEISPGLILQRTRRLPVA